MSNDKTQRQIDTILEQQARFSEDMLKLTDALLSLTHIVEQQGESISALIEQTKETDKRLNSVIVLFEKHMTEDHGKPAK
jgi:hypothetical protein